MELKLEERLAQGTRLLALAMWVAVGAASLPPFTTDVSSASKCSDACDGCTDSCKKCGEVNGVTCYDPKTD